MLLYDAVTVQWPDWGELALVRAGDGVGLGAGARAVRAVQLVTISRCAWASDICPAQTFSRSVSSTVSFGLGEAPGSGQRLRGSFVAPPSSSGTKWSYS